MEDNTLDQDLYTTAMKEALKVEFLESNEEIKLYAASLYNAMIWGKKVKEQKENQARDHSILPYTIIMQIYYLLLK